MPADGDVDAEVHPGVSQDVRVLRPVMRQTWRDVTFLHWPFDPPQLRKLIPAELQVDEFDGTGWVGLVPFRIHGLTTPAGPAVPWLSHFAETNVRTYVVDRNGRRGVWFFSLDAARWPAVLGARLRFGLPYYWSKMDVSRDGDSVRYASVRFALGRLFGSRRPPTCRVSVRIGSAVSVPSPLETFLTARFRLFAKLRGRLIMAEVSHETWPLQQGRLCELQETLLETAGVLRPSLSPLVHFAAGVDVLVAPPVPL